MSEIIMLCGLPGAGKSSLAEDFAFNSIAICPDEIRGELYGDPSIQGKGRRVFQIAYGRLKSAIKENEYNYIFFDATNTTKRARQPIIEIAKKYNIDISCFWINTSKEECIKRQSLRDRKVPTEVIERMARQFQKPTVDEGFKDVIIVTTE